MNDAAPKSNWRRFLWPSWTERKRALYKQAWIVVVLSWVALLTAWVWPVDLRNTEPVHVLIAWAMFMVQTFSLHIALMLSFIALVALRAKRWRLALTALPPALVIVTPVLGSYVPLNTPIKGDNELTVMSVNLLMINRDTQPIIDEILATDPDVLLLQEYTEHWRDALDKAIGNRYPHAVRKPQSDSFGAAIYSKRPFVEHPVTDLPLGKLPLPQLRIVVEHDGQRIALYNVHLLPPRTLAYTTEHRVELADLCDLLRDEPLPFVVAGDFNFTDATAHADAIRAVDVNDAWDNSDGGLGATWPVHSFMRYLPVPGLRIDHAYCNKQWTTIRASNGVGMGSDHRPITVTLTLDSAPSSGGPGVRGSGNRRAWIGRGQSLEWSRLWGSTR